jgi:hypothetical protein
MTSYLAGKTGVLASPSVSVKKAAFGTRLGDCPGNPCPENAFCPPGYSFDPASNVCVLMPVAGPVLPVVMAGNQFSRGW